MATYYCRADGTAPNKAAATSDNSAATSMSMTTANNPVNAPAPNDTVVISDKGGPYPAGVARLQPPASGTDINNPILYDAWGHPIIHGDGTYSLLIAGKSFLRFEGITFSTRQAYLFLASLGIVAKKCRFENSDTHGIQMSGTSHLTLNRCAVRNNGTTSAHNGINANTAGTTTVLRGCLVDGNFGRGLFSVLGAVIDYDYDLITGNSSSPTTNITVGADSIDGGHNVINGDPGLASYKANQAYIVLTSDDNEGSDGVGFDAGYWISLSNAIASYPAKMSLFARVHALTATGQANILALHNAGHEIGVHCWSHSALTATQAFDVTTTNAAPTIDVDVPGHQVILFTTTPGNSVTLDWTGNKMISDLQAAVAGKGWTITPKAGVTTALLLSSLADTGGAQAVPYTALLDRTSTDKGFFYDEIVRPQLILQAITGVLPRSYAWPGTIWDSAAQTFARDIAGMIGARGAGTDALSSINIYNVLSSVISTYMGDGTETAVRRMARHFFVREMEQGGVFTFYTHRDTDMTPQQFVWMVDEFVKLGANIVRFDEFVASIKTTHATADGFTYTKTYPDNTCYLLTPRSDAINAGVAVTGITTDYFGNPVPFGTAPDIGLHEYQMTVKTPSGKPVGGRTRIY